MSIFAGPSMESRAGWDLVMFPRPPCFQRYYLVRRRRLMANSRSRNLKSAWSGSTSMTTRWPSMIIKTREEWCFQPTTRTNWLTTTQSLSSHPKTTPMYLLTPAAQRSHAVFAHLTTNLTELSAKCANNLSECWYAHYSLSGTQHVWSLIFDRAPRRVPQGLRSQSRRQSKGYEDESRDIKFIK